MDRKKTHAAAGVKQAGNPFPFYLMLAAFAAAFTGEKIMFNNPEKIGGGLLLFGLALALVLAARVLAGKGQEDSLPAVGRRTEIIFFVLIMLLGTAFRVADIKTMPPGFFWDEGMYGQHAVKIMKGEKVEEDLLPVYIKEEDNAAAYIYMIAAVFKFFGIGTVQQRMASVIIGVLTVPAVYFMARAIFGPAAAISAGLLFAAMRWHLTFSRWGMHAIFAVFAAAMAFYFAWRAYKDRKWADFALLGLMIALLPNTYSAGRLVPVGLLFFVIYVLIKERSFFAENWKKMVLGTVVMIIFFSPMLLYIKKYPDRYFARARQISIFEQVKGAKETAAVLKRKTVETLMIFNSRGVYDPKHNLPGYPMLDSVTGTLAVLGMACALSAPLAPVSVLLISSFIVLMMPGVLTDLMAQGIRMITMIPVMIALAAFFLNRVFAYYRRAGFRSPAPKLLGLAALSVFTLISVSENFTDYFDKQEKTSQNGYTDVEYWMGKNLKGFGPGWQGILLNQSGYNYTTNFILLPDKNYEKFNPAYHIPIRPKKGVNYVYMMTPEYYEIAPMLRKMYPGGTYTEKRGKYANDLYFFQLAVPYAEIERANAAGALDNGLTGTYYSGSKFAGTPLLVRREPFLLFWGLDNPIGFPFSMVWSGRIKIETPGEYVFQVRTNGNTDLAIDGKVVSRTVFDYAVEEKMDTARITLSRGYHRIQARYWEDVRHLRYKLSWIKPGDSQPSLVPFEALYPDRAEEKKYADRMPFAAGNGGLK